MRRGVGRECDRLAGQVLDAVDALLADDAVGASRPIHHIDGVRANAFFLELGEVFGPDVDRGQHDVDVVGGQGRGAFGPVVDDLEGDF